ncbi:hypothetical protein B4135_1068 [Caldibacillus debilis]|uniref:Uncharacterized protein n=1 Tax=Caldibacillus debilis TaxID=301148 RepID=A0A150MEX1_9BACI|nr:hypothetical protein B4135_1068 [Caldibacillus debilis]
MGAGYGRRNLIISGRFSPAGRNVRNPTSRFPGRPPFLIFFRCAYNGLKIEEKEWGQ